MNVLVYGIFGLGTDDSDIFMLDIGCVAIVEENLKQKPVYVSNLKVHTEKTRQTPMCIYFFLICPILEAMTEILKENRWLFGRFKETKIPF